MTCDLIIYGLLGTFGTLLTTLIGYVKIKTDLEFMRKRQYEIGNKLVEQANTGIKDIAPDDLGSRPGGTPPGNI